MAGLEAVKSELSDAKQFGIFRPGQTERCGVYNVVSHFSQEPDRDGIDILIGEKFHGVVARWMSSAASTSMACWMQPRISSASRSG